jgi:haloalkane dehalogenase/tRNA(adenine34) deaminase
MAAVFIERGHRVVAPDWFGFGRSDKPVDDDGYTWDFHHGSMLRFLEYLDPQPFTLVVQDWGGLLGLTLPMILGEHVKRLLVMNTALATGDVNMGPGFLAWRDYVATQPDLSVSGLMRRSINGVTEDELRAYDAPFPDQAYKAGVRRFPAIVPSEPDSDGAEMSRRARSYLSQVWAGETFMAVGMQDPVLGPPAMAALRKNIAGCPEPMEVAEGGHFVQEHGAAVAVAACEAFGL